MNKKVYTEKKLFSKMIFITNALEQGWKVKKICVPADTYNRSIASIITIVKRGGSVFTS